MEIIIARNGTPAAWLMALVPRKKVITSGIDEGKLMAPARPIRTSSRGRSVPFRIEPGRE